MLTLTIWLNYLKITAIRNLNQLKKRAGFNGSKAGVFEMCREYEKYATFAHKMNILMAAVIEMFDSCCDLAIFCLVVQYLKNKLNDSVILSF